MDGVAPPVHLAVLTSGGDAQGMNAAVRAVVRAGLSRGATVSTVHEGYQGLVEGGDMIRAAAWDDVGGILHLGGTVIGTARCAEFTTREGRRKAVAHLAERGIDRLVVIGGDGTLTGAHVLRTEWAALLAEAVDAEMIDAATAAAHPQLRLVGLVGSIDNDLVGTDTTIGADSALHRITEALDAISSTAASHQRTFVVEVMGRRCGYLAVRGALAGSADWLLIPEDPPEPGWETQMCEALKRGRAQGRRDSIVVIAEGAVDRAGQPITAADVRAALSEQLGEEARITVLGHVQRGGAPSAFDRYTSTRLGVSAVDDLLAEPGETEPQIIGLRNNRITHLPLVEAVERTRAVNAALAAGDYETALAGRGGSFREGLARQRILNKEMPTPPRRDDARRIVILHAGGPAPGMNTTARAVTRFAIDRGHTVVGSMDGFRGLVEGNLVELDWMGVSGWGSAGGAELGVARRELTGKDRYAIARTLEAERIDALVMIGGWSGYESCHRLYSSRDDYPSFDMPIYAIPASINNNLPGTDLSVGSDTALNSIVGAVDRIKQSAVAAGRCFIVEVMGRYCGYLAMMSGLATGAECVYLPEEGISLADMQAELAHMIATFRAGKRLELVIRNEGASPVYTTDFMARLFEQEGGSLFNVRTAILGHQQQGGDPSPFDRILATRFASRVVADLDEWQEGPYDARFIGLSDGQMTFTGFEDFTRLVDADHQRPGRQWWLDLRAVHDTLAHPPTVRASAVHRRGPVRAREDHPSDQYHTQEES